MAGQHQSFLLSAPMPSFSQHLAHALAQCCEEVLRNAVLSFYTLNMVSAAENWLRITFRLSVWPWKLVRVVDPRWDAPAIVEEFLCAPASELHVAGALALRRLFIATVGASLSLQEQITKFLAVTGEWMATLRMLAECTDCLIADIEDSHSAFKHYCSNGVGFESVCALHFLDELVRIQTSGENTVTPEPKTHTKPRSFFYRMSAFHVFHRHRLAALHSPGSILSKENLVETRQRWNRMSAASRQHYVDLSKFANGIVLRSLGGHSQRTPLVAVDVPGEEEREAALPKTPHVTAVPAELHTCQLCEGAVVGSGMPLHADVYDKALDATPAKERARLWDAQLRHPVPATLQPKGPKTNTDELCTRPLKAYTDKATKSSVKRLRFIFKQASQRAEKQKGAPFALLCLEPAECQKDGMISFVLLPIARGMPVLQVVLPHHLRDQTPAMRLPPFPFMLEPNRKPEVVSELPAARRFQNQGVGVMSFAHSNVSVDSFLNDPIRCPSSIYQLEFMPALATPGANFLELGAGTLFVTSILHKDTMVVPVSPLRLAASKSLALLRAQRRQGRHPLHNVVVGGIPLPPEIPQGDGGDSGSDDEEGEYGDDDGAEAAAQGRAQLEAVVVMPAVDQHQLSPAQNARSHVKPSTSCHKSLGLMAAEMQSSKKLATCAKVQCRQKIPLGAVRFGYAYSKSKWQSYMHGHCTYDALKGWKYDRLQAVAFLEKKLKETDLPPPVRQATASLLEQIQTETQA
jgi:hypothetical protein